MSMDTERAAERFVEGRMNTDLPNLWPGMLATVKLKGDTANVRTVVRIVKRNPKTFKAELQDGRTVTGPHVLFTKAPTDAEFVSTKAVVMPSVGVFLDHGTVVRFKPGSSLFSKTGSAPFVVVNCDREGRHRVFPLGGSRRYWRNIPSSDLEVIALDRITIAD
jgi:hypothetical protein